MRYHVICTAPRRWEFAGGSQHFNHASTRRIAQDMADVLRRAGYLDVRIERCNGACREATPC